MEEVIEQNKTKLVTPSACDTTIAQSDHIHTENILATLNVSMIIFIHTNASKCKCLDLDLSSLLLHVSHVFVMIKMAMVTHMMFLSKGKN